MTTDVTSLKEGKADVGPEKANGVTLYSKYETSNSHESDGLWYIPPEFVGEEDAPEFLLARYGGENNKRFNRAMEKITRTERKAIDERRMSTGKSREIALETFLEASLLDWNNIKDREGKPISFSKKAASNLMLELPDLFIELLDVASDRAMYGKEFLEADIKN